MAFSDLVTHRTVTVCQATSIMMLLIVWFVIMFVSPVLKHQIIAFNARAFREFLTIIIVFVLMAILRINQI